MPPRAFKTQKDFRDWLEKNHAKVSELTIRLFRTHAKDKGIGYREMLDELLCFGWIDGIKKRYDDDSFTHRITPRKKKSNWSAVNIKRAKQLMAEGCMHAAGRAAFDARDQVAVAPYSFENRDFTWTKEAEREFRKNTKAWAFYETLPPWYRRNLAFWVANAKRDETRAARLAQIIDRCAKGISLHKQYASKPAKSRRGSGS